MKKGFTAIVLAADREGSNPVAQAAHVPCKALAPINGIPMITRVTSALKNSSYVGDIIVCGPERDIYERSQVLKDLTDSNRCVWTEPAESPSKSAWKVMNGTDPTSPILLTTADHALLSADMVDFFCRESLSRLSDGGDITAALALADTVEKKFRGVRRTSYRLGGKRYCSCNLFGFMNERGRQAALFWQQVEDRRKSPLRIVNSFGWLYLFRYLAGTLTLDAAMKRISSCIGCKAEAVIMPFPEAAVDVDTTEDLELVSQIADSLDKRQGT